MTDPEGTQRQDGQNPAAHGKTNTPRRSLNPILIWRWYNSLGNIERFTFWVALATGLLAILAIFQYRGFIESERAFISIDNLVLVTGEPQADSKMTFVLMLRNSGKHVAIIKDINFSMLVGTYTKELPDVPDYRLFNHRTALPIIPPNETKPAIIKVSNTLSKEDVVGIQSGAVPIFIFGYVSYDIGFTLWFPASTGYCFSFIPVGNRTLGMFDACNKQAYTYAN